MAFYSCHIRQGRKVPIWETSQLRWAPCKCCRNGSIGTSICGHMMIKWPNPLLAQASERALHSVDRDQLSTGTIKEKLCWWCPHAIWVNLGHLQTARLRISYKWYKNSDTRKAPASSMGNGGKLVIWGNER